MERASGGQHTAGERTARLFTVLGKARAKAVYTYDFGDGWDHEIVLEKCGAPEPAWRVNGTDRGLRGLPGFYNLLLGDDFDPEAFSVDDVN